MRMSDTSTCGAPPESASSASVACAKVLKGMPSRVRAFSKTQRIERSSSMTQTGFMPGPASTQRQSDPKTCPPRLALAFDYAVMVLYESLRQRQAETRAALPPRYERVENPVADLGRNARPVIDHLQF